MKEKIILLNPPLPPGLPGVIRDFYCSFSTKADYYWPPQDLVAFSGILREGYDLEIIDAVARGLSRERCLEIIRKIPAAAVLFSTGSVSLSSDIDLAYAIKEQKKVKLIASSSLFHFRGESFQQKYPFLDAVVGDMADTSPLEGVLGGEYIRGPKEGEFSLGRPQYEHFIGRGRAFPFFGGDRFAVVVSSSGCRFCCSFCVAGMYKIRYRKLSEVIDDLEVLKLMGVRKVFFPAPLFTADNSRLRRFCDEARGLGMEWVCNAHAATIQDGDLLADMRSAGCRALLIGVESGDDAILRRYRKGVDTAQIRKAFELARKNDIETLAYFIIGLPGDDAVSIQKTIDLSLEIGCDYASFGCATPDEGTALRAEAVANGWCASDDIVAEYDSSRAPALATGTLSREETLRWLNKAYADFYFRPRYIAKKIAGLRSWGELEILWRSGWALIKRKSW